MRKRKAFLKLLVYMVLLIAFSAQTQAAPKLSSTKLSLTVGDETHLKVSGSSTKVKWSNSNSRVVTISSTSGQKLRVTANEAGTAKITAKSGKTKLTCKITVSKMKESKRTIVYYGIASGDYLIEKELKKAGVNASMTDEQIVRKIYTWMGKHYIPENDMGVMAAMYKGYKRKSYYDADQLVSEIESFENQMNADANNGKIKIYQDFFLMESIGGFGGGDKYKTMLFDTLTCTIEKRMGTCNQLAKAFTGMCLHMGLTAGLASGNAGGTGHMWSWVKINGKKYYFDIWLAGSNYFNNKKLSYEWYKMSKSKTNKLYDMVTQLRAPFS